MNDLIEDGRKKIVSILDRPEGRPLPKEFFTTRLAFSVSILDRPEGRPLQVTKQVWAWNQKFQSSIAPKDDRYL